ncbi:hypothetical protein [Kosakonia cowanii]|uniref:hypothetical protein n=1 Tax=Kosakonia cowanii TaxID=208223 RepID=UPI0022E2B6AF|nr:hypothetical protein [Kosakonia cowanii]
MSTMSFKKKGNKQIALRVEPELEEAMQRALKEDGDATLSAWIKRVIRKELIARKIHLKK